MDAARRALACLGLDLLDRYAPQALTSARGAPGLGIPVAV